MAFRARPKQPRLRIGIAGLPAHDHRVTLTAAPLPLVKANTAVTVTSTIGDAHTHDVTINFA